MFTFSVLTIFDRTPTKRIGFLLMFIFKQKRFNYDPQGIIQKKSASGSWMLPCLKIFLKNFILI